MTTPETQALGCAKTVVDLENEIQTLRAQVEQYSNPTNIVRLALEIAAFRAHDEGRTVGELREAACTLFGAEAVGAAIDKARKA